MATLISIGLRMKWQHHSLDVSHCMFLIQQEKYRELSNETGSDTGQVQEWVSSRQPYDLESNALTLCDTYRKRFQMMFYFVKWLRNSKRKGHALINFCQRYMNVNSVKEKTL